MAVTSFGVNDTLSNKLWAKKLTAEALKETFFGKFMGESANSMIHVKTETQKAAGDKVTFGLRMQLSGAGTTEGQTLEGNEEALTTYADSIFINELSHAVRVKSETSIDAQRVPFNLRTEAKDGLRDWLDGRFDTAMFNHLAGYSLQTDLRYTGNNVVTAPSSTRIVRPATLADDAALTSSHPFTLLLIDRCVETAKTATPLIRPMKVNGSDMYAMFLHPYQVYDLRTSTTTGQWLDIQKAAMMGGKIGENPIFTGALGVYNNTILYESTRVPTGATTVAQTSTRRAVFCGAQAGALAWSQKFGGGDSNFKWVN